jgi:hypothetical protein
VGWPEAAQIEESSVGSAVLRHVNANSGDLGGVLASYRNLKQILVASWPGNLSFMLHLFSH